jgi:predicted hydrolase (HD superfamily)
LAEGGVDAMISENEALALVKKTSKYSHVLKVSTMMQAVAETLHENAQQWKLVGLIHDLDYDEVAGDFSRHGIIAAKKLEGSLPTECLHAIMAHDHRTGVKPQSRLDKALIAVDSLAVLIDLAMEKKSELVVSSFIEQINKTSETKPWLKQNIMNCSALGLTLDEFVAVCFDSMKKHGLV